MEVCGYLDTAGILHRCGHWGHSSKAEQLVTELNIKRTKPFDTCEDVLLRAGWICIRITDVYKAIRDYDGNYLFITEKQHEFFAKYHGEFNMRQLADIEALLKDFGKLYKRHKHDPVIGGNHHG